MRPGWRIECVSAYPICRPVTNSQIRHSGSRV